MVRVRRAGRFSSDKGTLELDEVIGKRYGDEVRLSTGSSAFLLRPLLLDYLYKGFKRVTQVLYPKDLGLIIVLLDVGPGSRVIEGGVGSGFLTASIARYVGDEGHVYAYEINERNIEVALSNLRMLGLERRVTFRNKDIRYEIEDSDADSAVLDIPDPWNALESLSKALKPTSPVIAFIPTLNQVMKLITYALDSRIAIDLRVYEVLLRDYEVKRDALRPKTRMVGHTGYITFMRILSKAQ